MPPVFGNTTHAGIASSETDSGEVDLRGMRLVGMQLATFTGATITFEAAEKPASEGGTFAAVVDSAGMAVSITATDDSYIVLDPAAMPENCVLTLISASAEAADRDIVLYVQPL